MLKKQLLKQIYNTQGSILGIGLQDVALVKAIDKNKKITYCDLLLSADIDDDSESGTLGKTIKMKKLRKYYCHQKLEKTFVNYETIIPYRYSFLKNSVDITNNQIVFYTKDYKDDLKNYVERYKRYQVDYKVIEANDGVIYIISMKNKKKIGLKYYLYQIKDRLVDLSDFLGDILSS